MRILCLGDTHFPYHSEVAFKQVYRIAKSFDPTHVVQMGDLYDQFAFSKYGKVIKILPEEELQVARALAEEMWINFKGRACYQLMGNHDDRALKKAVSVAPEIAPLVGKSLRELYTFPSVKTIHDGKEELILSDMVFHHGHRAKLGDHVKHNREKTVVAHTHAGGVVYYPTRRGMIWELNVGFLGDIRSTAFNYRAQKAFHTTTLGVGLIDELGPRFVPLLA